MMDRTHDMTLSGWSTDSNDPIVFSVLFFSCAAIGSQTNLSHWCLPSFDDILKKSAL